MKYPKFDVQLKMFYCLYCNDTIHHVLSFEDTLDAEGMKEWDRKLAVLKCTVCCDTSLSAFILSTERGFRLGDYDFHIPEDLFGAKS